MCAIVIHIDLNEFLFMATAMIFRYFILLRIRSADFQGQEGATPLTIPSQMNVAPIIEPLKPLPTLNGEEVCRSLK